MLLDDIKMYSDGPIGGRSDDGSGARFPIIQAGGITHTVLDLLVQAKQWELHSITLHKDMDVSYLEYLHNQAVWSNTRKGKLHLLLVEGHNRWGEVFTNAGLKILDAPKVSKRVAGLFAPRALSISKPTIKVLEVPQDNFATKDHGGDTEKLLDGAGGISRRVFEEMYSNWDKRVQGQGYPTFKIDAMSRRFENAIMVNGRCFTGQGLWKGNWYIMEVDEIVSLYGEEYDLIMPEGSLKKGVYTGVEDVYITLEVQEYHDVVHTAYQPMSNLRPMFTAAMLEEWAKDYFDHLRIKMEEGIMLDSVADILNTEYDAIDRGIKGESPDIKARWAAAEWVARGLDLRSSPHLMTSTASAKARSIMKTDPTTGEDVKFRLPVPCAWYMQLISESAAKMYGYKGKVTNGEARVWWKGKMVVISDDDYVEHYMRFGGADLDDFYQIYFRTYKGEKVIVALRSPNGWGEYGVFKFHEGDKSPVWKKANGEEEEFLEFKGALPKQLDLAIKDGDITMMDLEKADPHGYSNLLITREDAWEKVLGELQSNVSAGTLVNAVMLYYTVMKQHIPLTYGTLEDFIDLTTQDDLPVASAARLKFLAGWLVNLVVQSGKPIDKRLWEIRNYASKVIPTSVWEAYDFASWADDPSKWEDPDALDVMAQMWKKHKEAGPTINLVDSGKDAFFTIRLRDVREQTNKFIEYVADLAYDAQPMEGLMELGALEMGHYGALDGSANSSGMAAILRDARASIKQESDRLEAIYGRGHKDARISGEFYEYLFKMVNYRLITDDNGVLRPKWDQYNRVLGLAAASYAFRVSYGWCQYKGCTKKAASLNNLTYYGGKGYQRCGEHRDLVAKNPRMGANFKPSVIKDNYVMNRHVFPLYIAALEYFGIASGLGLTEEADPIEDWTVQCVSCKRIATLTNPVKMQEFESHGDRCITCYTRNATPIVEQRKA